MSELITLGETMVSFVSRDGSPLQYGPNLSMRIAGAESNTAIGVKKLGHSAQFISKISTDNLGNYVLRMLRAEGLETSYISKTEAYNTGIMFKETYSRDTNVYYYRDNSAASHLSAADIPENCFKNASIFHFTGITPLLSNDCLCAVTTALEYANQHKCKISFDPNIRIKIWGNKDYSKLIEHLMKQAHYIMIGLDEAEMLFGTKSISHIISHFSSYKQLEALCIKDGANGAWVYDKDQTFQIPPYSCNCIDPVGAGDAFNAGFLSGILQKKDFLTAGKMGAIMGASATETHGDIEGMLSRSELENILNNIETVRR